MALSLAEVLRKYSNLGPVALLELKDILGIIATKRVYSSISYLSGGQYTDQIMADLGYELTGTEEKKAIRVANWPDDYSVDLGEGITRRVKSDKTVIKQYIMKQ
jgi:hypothetical protein